MKLTCPNCATSYDVPDGAIGPAGRKVRCRACGNAWFEPGAAAEGAVAVEAVAAEPEAGIEAAPEAVADPVAPEPVAPPPARARRAKGPLLLLALVVLVAVLGVVAATLAFGPRQVAARFGLADRAVPLGIAISREPDWRQIADGSQLFAVSGRIWNPTGESQRVPDIRAELQDAQGKTVYAWTITRPVPRLGPGQAVQFDGAAVDVPASSTHVSVSFAGTSQR